MEKTFGVRIKHKRDTNENWTSKNPVLLNGEIILVDTADNGLRAKVGDGESTYTALPFNDEVLRNLIDTKVDKVSGKGLSTNDYTTAEKTKLAGIATGANKYTLPAATSSALGGVKIGSNISNSSGTISLTKSNVTSALGYTPPTTDTTYSEATTDTAGLMSATDKAKLDGVATGANKYTLPTASSTTLGGVKVGSNITNSSGTISLTKTNVTSALGYTPPTTNTTYSEATTSASGLMSATDKEKLDGIEEGANNYTLPTASSSTLGGVKTGSNITNTSGTISLTKANVTSALGYTPPTTNTTYSAATTETAGLMSATDKAKLDGIASGANKYSLPAAGSSLGGVKSGGDVTISSGVITVNDDSHNHTIANVDGLQDALDAKASSSHTHSDYVNQNAFSNVTVGSTTIAADSKTDTLTLVAGSNVTLTPDATNDKITIAAKDTVYTHPSTHPASMITGLADVATSGAYSDLSGTPTIPTKVSELENDSGFKTTDNNTTYSISKSGSTITLTGSDGSTTSVADSNTTYSAAGSSLGLVKSGGDVTISSGVITVNDDSHNHTIANVDGLQTALDGKETSGAAATALTDAKAYTDTSIANLINSAPTTLDTLGEIATAMEENADVVEALETAVGTKANASDLTAHTGNTSNPHNVTLSQLGVTATATELNYMDGVTSNVQTQLNGKASSSHTHSSYVNQNAFSNVTVGSTTIAADTTTDTLTLVAGNNVTLTADATNDKVTIAAKDTTYSAATTSANGLMSSTDKTKLNATNVAYGTCSTAAATAAKVISISGNTNWVLAAGSIITVKFSYTNSAESPTFNVNSTGAKSVWYNTALITTSNKGYAGTANRPSIYMYDGTQYVFLGWAYDSNTTYSAATTSAAGLMSADDKTKLNGIATGANKYTHPSYTAKSSGLYKVTVDATGHISATTAVAKSDITALGIPSSDTTYSAATTSAAGLMSAADKTKLDGIAAGANKYSLPTASSSTLGGVKTTSTVTSTSGLTACPIISGVPYYKDTNTTYSLSSFGITATAAELNKLDGVTATATEINYVDGVTSNIQTQLNALATRITALENALAALNLGFVASEADM